MSGSAFFAVIAFVILLVISIFMSPWFIIPLVVVGVFALMATPLFAAIKGPSGPQEGSGTPSTSEASYTPGGSGAERPI